MKQKNLLLILVGLIIIILIFATYLFIIKNKTTQNISKTSTNSKAKVEWKTYTDSNYKYSINYPASLSVKNKTSNTVIFDTFETLASMEKMEVENPDIYKYISSSPFFEITVYNSLSEIGSNDKCEETTINNNQGFSCTTPTLTKYFYIQKGVFIYKINFDTKSSSPDLQKQIINSIKFN